MDELQLCDFVDLEQSKENVGLFSMGLCVEGSTPDDEKVESLASMDLDGCEKNVNVDEGLTPNKDIQNFKEPYVGMSFRSKEEGKEYYVEYGRRKGFPVRVRSTQKTLHRVDMVTLLVLACARSGDRKKDCIVGIDEPSKSTNTVKCGCQANMRLLYNKVHKRWFIKSFTDKHNHKFVTPLKRGRMRTNRHMPKAAKDLTEAFNWENIPVGTVPTLFDGLNMGFDNRDCYNHLKSVRLQELETGDAQWVLQYFQMRLRENPQFFYAIQLDGSGRAVNFFWVDARSRMSYQHFGDMVTFDTTYRTNKYKLPFAPFTGVNHHYQTIQFGCALLQDETQPTFDWLFTTWLEAMGGCPPVSIITDQDFAMCAAIHKVFPNTRHRLCLWHMKKNFGENLSHVFYKNSRFKVEIKKCLQFTYSISDFEDKWNAIIQEFKLNNNEWLKSRYAIRESWVPVYHRSTFYAGMNTTGRSEGVNSFVNDYVSSKTDLRQFVIRYDQALKKIVEREEKEDYISEHKNRIIDEFNLILKHAANIYTRNIFDQFRLQLADSIRFKSEEKESNGDLTSYLVSAKVGSPEQFIVKLNRGTYEGGCQCQLFEFKGLPCKHILKVLVKLEMDEIPLCFILKRWTKGANVFRMMNDLVSSTNFECTEAFKLSHLCRRATQLSCIASKSDILYKLMIEGMEELFQRVLEEKCKLDCLTKGHSPKETSPMQEVLASQVLILDPHISQAKGRPRENKRNVLVSNTGRFLSPIKVPNKKPRKCKECLQPGHDTRKCPVKEQAREQSANGPTINEKADKLG